MGAVSQPQLLASVTDTMGLGSADDRITTYEYDATREHLLRVVAPGGRVTQYEYAPLAQLPLVTMGAYGQFSTIATVPDPRSHALTSVTRTDGTHDYFAYDTRGRLIETKKDANTERVTFAYGAGGDVTVTDSTNRATKLFFGLGGQLAQVRDPDGRVVGFGYDSKFQFNSLGGPGGEQNRYAYDAKGNLTGVRDAIDLQTSFAYEANFNQLAGFTDAHGNGIGYQYDAKGNLTKVTYADATHEDFTYDAAGNVASATNRRGQRVNYTYNALGEVLTKDYVATAGVDFTYQYDTAGNLTRAADTGGTTTMTYVSPAKLWSQLLPN